MNKWLRRIRGAVGMGLTWAIGWAVGGVLIGVASILLPFLPWDSFFRVFDAPLPAFAVPGFFAGAFFSIVLGIAARHRRFEELSLPRFAAWGALGGVMLILFPFALVAVGLASRGGSDIGTWQVIAVMGGPIILFSVVSASVTLMLARLAEKRESVGAGADVAGVGLGEGAVQGMLGGNDSSLHRHPAARPGGRVRPDPASGPGDA